VPSSPAAAAKQQPSRAASQLAAVTRRPAATPRGESAKTKSHSTDTLCTA
jgi:hypothetical protein